MSRRSPKGEGGNPSTEFHVAGLEMSLVHDLGRALREWTIDDGRIVIAVSGGADSIALLHALAEARIATLDLICAHVNQELRGHESEEDARFVQDAANSLGIECRVERARPDEQEIRARGLEAAARKARYRALRSIRGQTGARWIATAHTMEDQAETVLLRLLTGASIESLSAILPQTPDRIVRPLLGIRRNELRSWLDRRKIEYRSDSSNDDLRFVRNRIRHRLLPELESRDEEVVVRLASIADQMRAIRKRLEPVLHGLSGRWTRESARSVVAMSDLPAEDDLRRLMLLAEIRRLAPGGREVSSERLATLADELRNAGGVSLGSGIEARLDEEFLSLEIDSAAPIPFERRIGCGETLFIPEAGARIAIERVERPGPLSDDLRHLQRFTLPEAPEAPSFTIRSRLPGDRFQPLGLDHEKKLKDVLIDRKVPAEKRDRLPLLLYDDQIVWIPGVEVSERFRVEPGRALYQVRIDYEDS